MSYRTSRLDLSYLFAQIQRDALSITTWQGVRDRYQTLIEVEGLNPVVTKSTKDEEKGADDEASI